MYKYNSINHTNEKTEAFYCLKNNYDKEKTNPHPNNHHPPPPNFQPTPFKNL